MPSWINSLVSTRLSSRNTHLQSVSRNPNRPNLLAQQHTSTEPQYATQVLTVLCARSDAAAHLFQQCRISRHLSSLCHAFPYASFCGHLRLFSVICAALAITLRARATHVIERLVRILSLDGGSTRALRSLQVRRRVETLTGCPVEASFYLIAGTTSQIFSQLLDFITQAIYTIVITNCTFFQFIPRLIPRSESALQVV